jgi:circadian clock protein KaiC
MYGVESHLLSMQRAIDEFEPRVAVIDPITNLISIATDLEVKSMLVRLIDYLKRRQVTALFTNLVSGGDPEAATQVDISSLMDTWLLVRNIENNGERNRGLYILKSRGMPHSSQVREFRLSDSGVDLIDVYVAEDGVLTGTARLAREARQKAEELLRQQEIEIKQRSLERRRAALGSQIAALQADFASEEEELQRLAAQEDLRRQALLKNREEIALSRQADPSSNPGNGSEIRPEG